jgi:bifunctional ADP-heptose synthase (sugar kinase/adenylyltransferase)
VSTGPLVIVGDTLCDLDIHGTVTRHCPDAAHAPVLDAEHTTRRPGGAGLAAILAAATTTPVRLVTALADDDDGHWLADTLSRHLELVAGPAHGPTCTKIRMLNQSRPLLRLDYGHSSAGPAHPAMRGALHDAGAILVADYGRGIARALTPTLAALSTHIPIIWDPHPHGPDPVPGCAMITPNLAEARRALHAIPLPADPIDAALTAAAALRDHWAARAVAVTAGTHGAALAGPRRPSQLMPARAAPDDADPCGAGDCFATAIATELRTGTEPHTAVSTAVDQASQFVRAGGATTIHLSTHASTLPTNLKGLHEYVH